MRGGCRFQKIVLFPFFCYDGPIEKDEGERTAMRKRAFVGLAGILCAFALTVPVFAASYVDDCDSLAPDGTRSYGGFSEAVGDFDVFSGWGTCGDATALAVRRAGGAGDLPGQRRGIGGDVVLRQPEHLAPRPTGRMRLRSAGKAPRPC